MKKSKHKITMTFGQKLREVRFSRDMLAKELCELTGIPTTVISRYENDRRVPGFENMQLILEALGASSDDFIGCEMAVRKC